jgi:hypothetical protein
LTRRSSSTLGKDARVEPGHGEIRRFVIARLDRAILFAAGEKDATVTPWHDEMME